MSEPLYCITNEPVHDMPGNYPRKCVKRDFKTRNPENHWNFCRDDDCRGCMPKRAEVGLLCYPCWERTSEALSKVREMIVHLRSISKESQPISERVSTSLAARLPVPSSWLAADELVRILDIDNVAFDSTVQQPNGRIISATASLDDVERIADDVFEAWEYPETVVATQDGAERAVLLWNQMRTALARWPMREAYETPLPEMIRCPKCGNRSMVYRPPLERGDDQIVRCGMCPWQMDWDSFASYARPIMRAVLERKDQDMREREKRRREHAAA